MKRNYVRRKDRWSFITAVLFLLIFATMSAKANEPTIEIEPISDCPRMKLYQEVEYTSRLPWYQIAAIDQYERNIATFRKSPALELVYDALSIRIDPDVWSGPVSPNQYESCPAMIAMFGGIGLDGDGDGIADINNEIDVLYTMVEYIRNYETFEDAVKAYYPKEEAARLILGIARLFEHFGTIELGERAFPVSKWNSYSYSDGYGCARSWGGCRAHEGIDIFANYGATVVSTSYGIVEVAGWNDYGGYRLGIRDIYNTYQYYAHLQGFADDIEVGMIVVPGQVIGSVGSTGYGPEGTSGKFEPHLHFGLYKYDGRSEWAFNPYPHLVKWE